MCIIIFFNLKLSICLFKLLFKLLLLSFLLLCDVKSKLLTAVACCACVFIQAREARSCISRKISGSWGKSVTRHDAAKRAKHALNEQREIAANDSAAPPPRFQFAPLSLSIGLHWIGWAQCWERNGNEAI